MLPNTKDEADSQELPSLHSPTELTKSIVLINTEHVKDVVAVEVVELHPLSEEDEEVANQGHLEDGDLVGTPHRCLKNSLGYTGSGN